MSVDDPEGNSTQLLIDLKPKKGRSTNLIRKILILYELRARIAMKRTTFNQNESTFQKRVGNQSCP